MEGRAQALVAWLEATTNSPTITAVTQLKDCRLLEQVLGQIDGFSFAKPDVGGEWKDRYARLRRVYEQVETYLVETLRVSPPSSLSVMNLVEMAKGESEEGLESLLLLVFIVCIRCPIKQTFIHSIINLPAALQVDLMQIIQDWQTEDEEKEKEEDSELSRYKQQIARIQFLYQNLVQENSSLRISLDEVFERSSKNQELIAKLQQENERLQRELSQRSEQLRLRQENIIDKYAQHNEDIMEDLKKRLLEQESEFGQEVLRLKQKVEALEWELGDARKQASDLEEKQAHKSLIQSRDDHISCVPIEKHKMKVNELLSLNKQAKQIEIAIKLENVQLKSHISELQLKLKKQSQEIRKKNQEFMINTEDANKLKIEVFTRLRNELKKRYLDNRPQHQEALADRLDFQDDL